MSQYYITLTTAGLAALAAALANNTDINATHIAVGDGGGVPVVTPSATATALVNEVHRTVITSRSVASATTVEFECIIAADVGTFTVRECGLYAGTVLIAICNFPDTIKTIATSGAARDMRIVLAIKHDNASSIAVSVNASQVGATQHWVNTYYVPLTHLADTNPHPQYATQAQLAELVGGITPANADSIYDLFNVLVANAATDAKQVSVAAPQAFTPAEKEQGRENIEAVGMQEITDGLAAMAAGVGGYPRITGLAVSRALPVTATGASNGLQYASPSLVRAVNTFSYTCRQIFGTVRMVGHTYGGNVNIYVNGTVVYGGYGAGGWVDTVITVTEGDLIQATCGGAGYYNFSIYVNDPIVELSPIVYASQLNSSANTSLIAGLITASTSFALNDQWLRVLSGNQVGYLATDGSVPANQYALANAFNLTGQFDNNNFYGFIVDVEWLVLSGTVMIEPNTTDLQDRNTQIIQTRAGATIFTETYTSAALARPVLTVEVGDIVKVSIEQNSTGVSVALRWIPTFS